MSDADLVSRLLLPVVASATDMIADALTATTQDAFQSVAGGRENPALKLDLEVQSLYLESLRAAGLPCRVVSEHGEWSFHSTGVDELIVYVDPVDGTEFASRRLSLCSTAVAVVDSQMHLVFAAVGDVGRRGTYWAIPGYAGFAGQRIRVDPQGASSVGDAFVCCYAATKKRIVHDRGFQRVLEACGGYLNFGGPLLLARLADSTVDVVVEYKYGYPPFDFLPGYFVAREAGASVLTLDGKPLHPRAKQERYSFVGAASVSVLGEVVQLIGES